MLKLRLVAMLLTAAALVSPAWQGPTQTTHGALKQPPIVSPTEAPPGTETLAVKWIRVAVPDRGVMLAAVARPSGAGPFPALGLGAYEEGLQYIDGLVQATRALPGARPDRFALVGHSRGGGASLQYIHTGDRQRAGHHSS